jgi:uncharacterized membrane protein YraQ (UPF0718 family)
VGDVGAQQVVTLLVTVLGLFVGPGLATLGGTSRSWSAFLDGASLTLVSGACLLHLGPHALAHGGFLGLAGGVMGAALPGLLHRLGPRAAGMWSLVGFAALALHGASDGAALAVTEATMGSSLTLALVAHRLTEGLAVHDYVKRRIGAPGSTGGAARAWGVLVALALATVGGFAVGTSLAPTLSEPVEHVLEGLIAGALLSTVLWPGSHDHGPAVHQWSFSASANVKPLSVPLVVGLGRGSIRSVPGLGAGHVHCDHPSHRPPPKGPNWSAVGAVVGLGIVVVVTGYVSTTGALPHVASTARTLLSLSLDSAPALLLGFVLSGLVSAFLDPARATWLSGGSQLRQALRGVVFGLPLPVCSCGVVPLYRTLVKRGVPATAALAFLVATPELGLDAVLLSVPLLGVRMTIARVLAAFTLAFLVAFVVGRTAPAPATSPSDAPPAAERTVPERIRQGVRHGLGEVVDHTLPWIVAGLLIAALAEPLLDHDQLLVLPPLAQVPMAAAIGIPLYVCASGATPLAAMAVHKGVSGGAALAFLLSGPATNLTTFTMLTALHGRAFAARFGVVLLGLAVLTGYAVDAAGLTMPALPLDGARPEAVSVVPWTALGALGAVGLASLFRQGPRGAIDQLVHPIHVH